MRLDVNKDGGHAPETLAALLRRHFALYPEMEIQDAVKLIYQHAMGSEHLVTDAEQALRRLKDEWAEVESDPSREASVPLGTGLCRLELAACKAAGLAPETVMRLFFLSARRVIPDAAGLAAGLDAICTLPFSAEEVEAFLSDYRVRGCPALHHSERYRAAYRPAYRVVLAFYAKLLPALAAIDQARDGVSRLLVAVDGPCASGKTTFAAALSEIYRCPLVHADDFFLRPEQRTPERLAEPGGNVDYERLEAEVLSPLRQGRTAVFRPWDCKSGAFGKEISVPSAPLVIVEGSYSLHPSLRRYYDLAVWVGADMETRRRRLRQRGGQACLDAFESRWIPLENAYFSACCVEQHCQVRLDLS